MSRKQPQYTEEQKAERALIAAMASFELLPGQMLWLGPQSVQILSRGGFAGKLPDKIIFERKEWEAAPIRFIKPRNRK